MNITAHTYISGEKIKNDKEIIQNKVQIIISTPRKVFETIN
jgi:hypothetical protein